MVQLSGKTEPQVSDQHGAPEGSSRSRWTLQGALGRPLHASIFGVWETHEHCLLMLFFGNNLESLKVKINC